MHAPSSSLARLAKRKKSCVKTLQDDKNYILQQRSWVAKCNFVLIGYFRMRSLLRQMSIREDSSSAKLVGLGGFEPPTSPLSGVRSNQLSYRPGILRPGLHLVVKKVAVKD